MARHRQLALALCLAVVATLPGSNAQGVFSTLAGWFGGSRGSSGSTPATPAPPAIEAAGAPPRANSYAAQNGLPRCEMRRVLQPSSGLFPYDWGALSADQQVRLHTSAASGAFLHS